jgi:LmbE family N-acetylglucosaminyl deacetylase
MMMRSWFVGAAAVVVLGGAALRGKVLAAGGVVTAGEGQEQRQTQGSFFAALRVTAKDQIGRVTSDASGRAAAAGHVAPSTREGGLLGREATSLDDDPANLKGERVRAVAEEPLAVDRGTAGLEQMLRKLRTRASLLMIVAHPDDEDGGMLAYESRGQGARVGMLTLTRGEGGQNVVTGDFDEALGLVRTRELLAADRYMGVDQMFGTEVDFGFSKTKEEAFEKWGHERVLYDAVRAVRLYRPLVVASVFIGAPTDGHGQHQVSGEIAQEVFNAAADPKVFPEMGLPVWAPAKVYARVPFARVDAQGMFDYATGKYVPARFYNYVTKVWSTREPEATVTIPEGEPSAVLGGKSYVQFARQGLALQRTQIGAGVRLAPAGKFDVGYTRYGSRVGERGEEKSFFDGVDTSLSGIAGLAPSMRAELGPRLAELDALVKRATGEFSAEHPERSAPLLGEGLRRVDGLIGKVEASKGTDARERYDVLHELRVKRVQFNQALVLALGVGMKAGLPPRVGASGGLSLVPGSAYTVQAALRNGSGTPFEVGGCEMEEHMDSASSKRRIANEFCTGYRPAGGITAEFGGTAKGEVPADARGVRVPYSKANAEQAFYDLSDPRMRDAPLPLPALTAWMELSYDGVPLRVGRVVGEEENGAYQPVTVVPAVSVSVTPQAGVVPLTEKSFRVTARVGSAVAGSKGTLRLVVPKGWKVSPERMDWSAEAAGKDVAAPFTVTPERVGETPYPMTAVAESGGREYREGYHAVGYPGLVRDNLYAPATYRARGVDVKVPAGLRVAYLPGTGDAVEMSLEDIGIRATTVSVADIAAGGLAGYDALLMGVRTYAAQKDLPGVTAKLTEFATAGGVVVVQYQSGEYTGADAPYPLAMGAGLAERVVEENSRVHLLDREAQVLRWPNRISEADFGGWVEERGHGFMLSWDPHYEAVTEVHDEGQDPQKGGLLVARVGKGAYVYCAYALYRQMPEGVPGAFRLMANMVSLGKRPTTEP